MDYYDPWPREEGSRDKVCGVCSEFEYIYWFTLIWKVLNQPRQSHTSLKNFGSLFLIDAFSSVFGVSSWSVGIKIGFRQLEPKNFKPSRIKNEITAHIAQARSFSKKQISVSSLHVCQHCSIKLIRDDFPRFVPDLHWIVSQKLSINFHPWFIENWRWMWKKNGELFIYSQLSLSGRHFCVFQVFFHLQISSLKL